MPVHFLEIYRSTTEAPLGFSGWPMTAVLAFSAKGRNRTEFHMGRLRFLIWNSDLISNTWANIFVEATVDVDYYLTGLFTPDDFEDMGILSVRVDSGRLLTIRYNGAQRGQAVIENIPDSAWNETLPLGVSLSYTVGDPYDADLQVANMAFYSTALSNTDLSAVEAVIASHSGVAL